MELTKNPPAPSAAPDAPRRGITVVIPVFNREKMVGRTLKCVETQTYRPMNVVLVDNNSTDNTADVLRAWAKKVEAADFHVQVITELRPSAAAARLKGSEGVETEYVMFFDSDDLMAPRHVGRAMEAFASDPTLDIVGWDFDLVDTSMRKLKKCRFWRKNPLWHTLMNGSLSTQRYAMRTSLLLQAGNWEASVRGWNDIELGCRILQCNPKIKKIKGSTTVTVISHPDSITGTSFSADPEKWEHALDCMQRSMHSRQQLRMVLMKRAILAGEYAREGALNLSSRQFEIIRANDSSAWYRMLYRIGKYGAQKRIPAFTHVLRLFF